MASSQKPLPRTKTMHSLPLNACKIQCSACNEAKYLWQNLFPAEHRSQILLNAVKKARGHTESFPVAV